MREPGCMFCDTAPLRDADGNRLPCAFERPPAIDGRWGKVTSQQAVAIRHGRSPGSGEPLLGRETCGTCRHLHRRKFARVYLKCRKGRDTNGPATDIKAKWPACVLWEALDAQV